MDVILEVVRNLFLNFSLWHYGAIRHVHYIEETNLFVSKTPLALSYGLDTVGGYPYYVESAPVFLSIFSLKDFLPSTSLLFSFYPRRIFD